VTTVHNARYFIWVRLCTLISLHWKMQRVWTSLVISHCWFIFHKLANKPSQMYSLAMPKLKSILEYDPEDNRRDPGLKIEAWNTPIDITLPALETVDSLSIEGTSITEYVIAERYV